jgi:pantoate--beta-alanine ligase
MRTIRSIGELRQALEPLRAGSTIGFVPTMGALHAGHLALFAAASRENDVVVASLFVNPAQFDDREDLARYPSDEQADARVAERAGVDYLFAPSPAEIYPDGFQTWVDVEEMGRPLEGEHRAGHFRGVATVCLKLFNIVRPHRAYFGQKDAQQAAVVTQLVRDLNLELEIRVVPTAREADGLAISSRNVRLSETERRAAAVIPRALRAGAGAHRNGRDAAAAARAVLAEEPSVHLDYVEVARFDGLPPVLVAAVRIGGTRLIDNVPLEGESA